jgi:hypothetical protein
MIAKRRRDKLPPSAPTVPVTAAPPSYGTPGPLSPHDPPFGATEHESESVSHQYPLKQPFVWHGSAPPSVVHLEVQPPGRSGPTRWPHTSDAASSGAEAPSPASEEVTGVPQTLLRGTHTAEGTPRTSGFVMHARSLAQVPSAAHKGAQ